MNLVLGLVTGEGSSVWFSMTHDDTKHTATRKRRSGKVPGEDVSVLLAHCWDELTDGLRVVSRTGEILLVNDAFCRMVSMTRGELIGSPFSTIYERGSRAEFEQQFVRGAAAEDFPSPGEQEFLLHNGRPVRFQVTHARVNRHGRAFLISTFRDVTPVRVAEERLRMSENKLHAILDQSSDGIGVTDEEGRILEWNRSQELLTGLSRGAAIGRKCWDVLYEMQPPALRSTGQRDYFRHTVLQLFRPGEADPKVLEIVAGNGTDRERKLQHTLLPVSTERGTTLTLITRERARPDRVEHALEEAMRTEAEARRLKWTMLANLSHEFRTPISGILGMADLLRADLTTTTSLEKVDGITLSAKRLHATLDAMLKLAQLSAGELTFRCRSVDLVAVARRVVERFRPDASRKGLSIILHAPDPEVAVLANDELVTDIVGYLVDNGVKYTEQGSVTVTLAREDGPGGPQGVLVVSDTGIGIAPSHQEVIFQEFKQVSEGYGRRFEGSGLGLVVAKRMTELLHGSIEVRSELGSGAAFTVRLPAVETPLQCEVPSVGSPVAQNLPPTSLPEVLIVEDNFLNKAVMCNFLSGFCKADHARDAQSAIEMAKGKRYSVILMDINLGAGQSGLDATKEIRRIPGYEHRPIIAVTGYTLAGERDRLLSAGLTYYVAKPFDREEIVHVVSQALSESR